MSKGPIASIVIPAHNEARVITRTLHALTTDADANEFDIVVVCNGCTDDTQRVAESFEHPGVRVLAIQEPSKALAMNHGDSAARTFPRLYLDADVELSVEGARAMTRALTTEQAAVATPSFQLEGCTPMARQYWLEWQRRNPQPRAGTGCFGLSSAARGSFEAFPEVLGDDLWVASSFSPVVVDGAETRVRVARTLRAVFRRRVRIQRGNRERVADLRPPRPNPPARDAVGSRDLAGRHRAFGVFLLAGVHASAIAWARVRPTGGWAQDVTSRA